MVKIRNVQNSVYVVHASDVDRICAILDKEVGSVTIETECSDDIEREFSNHLDLFSYDNPPSRGLLDVWILSSRRTATEANGAIDSASVHFSQGGGVSISVTGTNYVARTSKNDSKISLMELRHGTVASPRPWIQTSWP